VEIGRLGAVSFLRELVRRRAAGAARRHRVGLAPGESVAMPEEGVSANVQLAHFDVDAWEDALARVPADRARRPRRRGAARAAARRRPVGYLPTVLALRARSSASKAARCTTWWSAARATAGLARQRRRRRTEWLRRIPAAAGTGAGRVIRAPGAPEHRRGGQRGRDAAGAAAGNIPALDVVVDDFELKGRKLGRLEIDAVNRGAGTVAREGGVREWRLNKLSLSARGEFTASGNWAALARRPPRGRRRAEVRKAGERRRTAMKFRWTSPTPASCSPASA
jgi:uncharacterized protein YhdP